MAHKNYDNKFLVVPSQSKSKVSLDKEVTNSPHGLYE